MTRALISGVFVVAFALPSLAGENSLHKIETFAALDLVAPFNFKESEENKLSLRAVELGFFGSLDSAFDAHLNVAAHDEHGEFLFEVHEAFVSSKTLIPSTRFKAGKFHLGVGILNRLHRHDWAFVSAPRVQSEFFSDTSVADTGLEFTTFLPTDYDWDLTVGVTNGYNWGHSHDEGEKPRVPTHYLHPVNIVTVGENATVKWGLNYVGRTDAEGEQMQLYGFDFSFKNLNTDGSEFLLQSEIWYRNLKSPEEDRSEDLGAYIYPQTSLSEKVFAGLRLDLFTELSRVSEADGSRQENLNYGFVPTLTYKYSEFTWLRMTYAYNVQTLQGESDQLNQAIELQIVSTLDAHHQHQH